MTGKKKSIEAGDLIGPAEYAAKRAEWRRISVARKKLRRVEVGPVATFSFESYDTMLRQVQEMLHIEKGGAEQIADELRAYNPLIPQGAELIATVMFEIDDPIRRARLLSRIGGIEQTAFIRIGDRRVAGVAETDQDRTSAEGKASSVQFIHFPFAAEDIAAFRAADAEAVIGFSHPEYSHMAVMPEAVRNELAGDFD